MRKFWRKSGAVPLMEGVRLALKDKANLSEETASTLRMLVERGQFENRPVTYFRVFDPLTIRQTGVPLRRYDNLPFSLVLHAGFLEENGKVILTASPVPSSI